ncbi:hypothetical protein [Chryseobacterium sp. 22458]|uniref:hypothetical protein n=1 Tax=Chryseobacterium sp. 22458 TaxID=3453921 RepID=UPI003F865185
MIPLKIDYEKLYQELENQGKKLTGLFELQYPIYCVHATIADITPDPLDYLDVFIIDIIRTNNKLSTGTIGSFLGVSKIIIEMRINILKGESLVEENESGLQVSDLGYNVFVKKVAERIHIISYDFYIDGITHEPLNKQFYRAYRSKFISENDKVLRTNKFGESFIECDMKPDLVHTPFNKERIIEKLKNISMDARDEFAIPIGFKDITDISYTKLSFQILVAASIAENGVVKEVIDGFANQSYIVGRSYYDDVRQYITNFEDNIKSKVQNLVFKVHERNLGYNAEQKVDYILSSNWREIDRYPNHEGDIFQFDFEGIKHILSKKLKTVLDTEEDIEFSKGIIEFQISKKTLQKSTDRKSIISNLLRGRDYLFDLMFKNFNVQLLYIYYSPADEIVEKILEISSIIKATSFDDISEKRLLERCSECPLSLRQILILGGHNDILEKFDMEKNMILI